jgi:ubiquinone/menaquinone biosynthesis C-methylase UbiE
MMAPRDAMTYINDMDDKVVQMFIDRLEFRGKDPTFVGYRDAYVAKMGLSPTADVLEIGCGTGVVARAIAARPGFAGHVTGIDQSPAFIAAAERLAAEAGVESRTTFQVGDVHAMDFPDARFDAVVAHTVISHVLDPLAMLKDAARVIRPGGAIAIFDGDYASWTFASPDHALAKAMEEGIIAAVVNQPRVMRDMPRLLRQARLERVATLAYVYADIGKGTFFSGAMEGYAPLVAREGLVSGEQVDAWLTQQRRAMEEGVFFAACNYYAYIARHGA